MVSREAIRVFRISVRFDVMADTIPPYQAALGDWNAFIKDVPTMLANKLPQVRYLSASACEQI